uniref:Retrotrans_gag domain-containing protein n=1 Tax=Loa loa TaxID=7209 RepID=A0A1I7VK09_LOALO
MWGQFISQFEESIQRTDLTPTQKFKHLLSSLKGGAREQICDIMVNEENYPLGLENLYERFGDKKQRVKELYKSLERVRCSNKEPFRMIRELLNLQSQLKGLLGESMETAQLDVMIEESEVKPPDEMRSLIGQRCNEQDKRFANWESGIRRSTVCSTVKERIYPSRVSQKKEGGRLPLFFVKVTIGTTTHRERA